MTKGPPRYHGSMLDEANALETAAWIWKHRRARMTVNEITALMALPVSQGGLAKVTSVSSVWRSITRTRAEKLALMGKDIAAERLEAIEELDEISLGIRELAGKWLFLDDGRVVARNEKLRLEALLAMADVALKRAKLSGLEAPIVIEANIVHSNLIDTELDALIAQANKGK